MGAQREAAITSMLEMGYERDNIDRAMRAAFYNPDRAVDYLLNVSLLHHRHFPPGVDADRQHRAFLRICNMSGQLGRHQPPRAKQPKPLQVSKHRHLQPAAVAMERTSTCLKQRQMLLGSDNKEVVLVAPGVLATLNSSATTPNFSNYDKWYSNSHRCWSQFYNKSARVTQD